MDKNDVLNLIRNWQIPSIWKCTFQFAQDRKNCLGHASESHRLANENENSNWRQLAKTEEVNAETFRQEVLTAGGELLKIKDYLRAHFPRLLPLVPMVNFFSDEPGDGKVLAKKMLKLEAELLALLPSQTPAEERNRFCYNRWQAGRRYAEGNQLGT